MKGIRGIAMVTVSAMLNGICATAGAQAAPTAVQQTTPVATVGGDVVVMKDGGMLRGTLTELIPNDHATVQLANGQLATVRWDAIERVDRANATAAAAPPAPAAPAAPSTAVVHINGDDLSLQASRATGDYRVSWGWRIQHTVEWNGVCSAPCDQPVPLEASYRIDGPGIRPTEAFALQSTPSGRVVLDVNRASSAAHGAGLALLVVGIAADVVGGVAAGSGAVSMAVAPKVDSSAPTWVAVGLTTLGVGLVMTVIGIVLMVTNSKSKVTISSAPTSNGPAQMGLRF